MNLKLKCLICISRILILLLFIFQVINSYNAAQMKSWNCLWFSEAKWTVKPVRVQCWHLIPALNVRAPRAQYTSAHLIATQFSGLGCMEDFTTGGSFDLQATYTWVIDVLGLFFDMLSINARTTRHWETPSWLVQELNVCTVSVPKWSDWYAFKQSFVIFHSTNFHQYLRNYARDFLCSSEHLVTLRTIGGTLCGFLCIFSWVTSLGFQAKEIYIFASVQLITGGKNLIFIFFCGSFHHQSLEWQRDCCIQVNLDMTDHCTTDFCIWRTICLVPVGCISSIRHMYTTNFAYDGPIFLVPLSLSYPSSPVLQEGREWIQCQSLIPALNVWATWALYSTTHSIASQFPGNGWPHNWT